MTAVRKVHLRCDGFPEKDCEFQLGDFHPDRPYPLAPPYGSHTVAAERVEAARAGWTREGKSDFCKPCTERRKAAE